SIYAIDADDSENQLSPLFFSLKQTLKSYIEKNQYNTINLELYKIENNSKIFKEFNDSDFKKIFQEFIVSCEAFKQIKKINNAKIEKFFTDKEGNKFLFSLYWSLLMQWHTL
ncbi:hypothetical protein KU744_001889, partial [Campylobacter jejuni]|nr:hypothetical protein [Campylobacter jejuni]